MNKIQYVGPPDGFDDDLPGDPVCLMRRVCMKCGAVADEEPPTICPQCGEEMPAD
ncbi:MAG: hypothetical protein M0030_01700 [Actinomycetota bacterium]|jgi:rRNA maturation endonuclease Nob1|nr:hypothetical protein [Actinomycetota bacterium]